MGRLTFDEFMKLSEEERGRREVELSPHDRLAVRMNHWPTEEEKKEAEGLTWRKVLEEGNIAEKFRPFFEEMAQLEEQGELEDQEEE